MPPTVHRLDPSRRGDFFRLHSEANECGWCSCVAWWVPAWDGWGERTADANRALRQELFDRGEDDGYLLYDASEPVGWIQVGPRDRLGKLMSEYRLAPDPRVWAITCFLLVPRARGQGWARLLLQHVLTDLQERGIAIVEAFPRRGAELDAGSVWTGPEPLFVEFGFKQVQDHPRRPRYRLELAPTGA